MKQPILVIVSALLSMQLGCAQQKPKAEPPQQPDAAAVVAEVMQQLEHEHIAVDAKAKTVTIDAVMNQPPDPIEYLLINRRGKMHEAIFYTESKPSVLNAALLMIGFEPGTNATYEEKKPAPTLEEIEKGADPIIVHPPTGMQVWMTVHWKDKDGKQHDCCVDDLILDMRTGKPLRGASWFYLGGMMASIYRGDPPVFVADYEGNLASTCYMSPQNHLVTMAHENARDQNCWWITDKCPEPETTVKYVFHKDKPKLYVEREARLAKEPKDEPVEPAKTAEPAEQKGGDKGDKKGD